MSLNAFTTRATEPDVVKSVIRILGADDANPTEQIGAGTVTTRTGEGAYRITWADNPGTYLGHTFGFQAATPADLKGYTVVTDTYDATNKRLDLVIYNSSFAAADIIANQYLYLEVAFKRTSVAG